MAHKVSNYKGSKNPKKVTVNDLKYLKISLIPRLPPPLLKKEREKTVFIQSILHPVAVVQAFK